MRPIYPPRVEQLIERMSTRERTTALALQALFARADEQGRAGVHDVALAFRDDYLRALRDEGKNAEHEAGRLSLDEVDAYVAEHALPRLTEDGVIRQLGPSLKDPDAAVIVEEGLWRDVAPVRAEVARIIYEACDYEVDFAAGTSRLRRLLEGLGGDDQPVQCLHIPPVVHEPAGQVIE